MGFLVILENFEFILVDVLVCVVINSCIGIIVIGSDVCLLLVVIIYGGLMVIIFEN